MKFKVSILNFLMLAALSFVPLHIAYSQTASILPPAKTTYLDKNGKPLAFGTVDFYIPGTTTPKTTWQDAGQTIPNTNPVVLDNAGRSLVLGDGSYRQIVRDKNGNVIWDQVTSSTGSGGGGGGTPTVGDGDPVGMIKAWSGFTAPSQYVFAYGQEFVRASYPELLSAITSQQNVNCTSGSPTLTGVSDTSQLSIGSNIESNCLNSGATIVSKTTNTVVASSNAIISTTTTARFFPYGNGNGSSTFNLPDLRGRTIAGRDNMGGIASNRLPQLYNSLGGAGGVDTVTLVTSNLPPYTPTGSISNGAITTSITGSPIVGNTISGVQGGSTFPASVTGAGTIGATSSQATSTFSGAAQGGASQPLSVVQPTISSNYIIKVIPDSNPNSFFGVASIGGMYGVIECGFGLTCSGNTISSVNSLVPAPTLTTLGGVYESSAPSNQFAIGIDAAGNVLYGGGSTTVNGQVCVIGGACTITATAGAITVGTTLVGSGNNNGILYKDASGILANTGSANDNIVITNGSGVPTLSATLPSTNLASNSIANSKLSQMNATTIKGNPTNSTANAQDFTIQSLSNLASPDPTLDYIPIYDHASNTIKNVTPSAISSAGVLPSIANNTLLANISGATAQPVSTTPSGLWDAVCSSAVGQVWVRFTSAWGCSYLGYANPVWWGADPTGGTDSTSAFNSAISTGLPIKWPSGYFQINSAINVTLSTPLTCFCMEGNGSNNTVLNWPFSNGGINIVKTNTTVNFQIKDITLSTSQTNSGSAINVNGTGAQIPYPPQSSVINVQIRGDDFQPFLGSHCWANGIFIHEWSAIYINNVNTYGTWSAPGDPGCGIGIFYEGNSATSAYATHLNIVSSAFNFHNIGINLGDYWQGVTCVLCNFNGQEGSAGIYVPSSATGVLAGLWITASQFDTGGNPLYLGASVLGGAITNNTISVYTASSNAIIANGGQLTFTGNVLNSNANGATQAGIVINSATNGTFIGNTINGIGTGVVLTSSSSYWTVGMNSYLSVSTPISNSGTNNSVGTASAGAMTGVVP